MQEMESREEGVERLQGAVAGEGGAQTGHWAGKGAVRPSVDVTRLGPRDTQRQWGVRQVSLELSF